MMLTFVRTGELIAAKWNEIDLEKGQWMIPAERMKMRKTHIVPLTPQTIALFRELKALAGDRDFVFPSQINSKKHMSNNTILKALERMGYKGQMTGHGFRALAMNWAIAMKWWIASLLMRHATKSMPPTIEPSFLMNGER